MTVYTPYSPEALRLVGNRMALRTARRICLDLGANGPSTAAQIAKRTGAALTTVHNRCMRMVQVGWLTNQAGTYHLCNIADPFPPDL